MNKCSSSKSGSSISTLLLAGGLALAYTATLEGGVVAAFVVPTTIVNGRYHLALDDPPFRPVGPKLRIPHRNLPLFKSDSDETSSSDQQATRASPGRKQTLDSSVATTERDPDDENTSENVFGAEFFGGNKIKEELFDPIAEDEAAEMQRQEREAMQLEGGNTSYRRFEDRTCFVDAEASVVASRLQAAINGVLYSADGYISLYGPGCTWITPFPRAKSSANPLDELSNSLDFYKRIDAAIIGGRTLPSTLLSEDEREMEFRWEVSVIWPNVWESRVVLTGTSKIVWDSSRSYIVSQRDRLDGGGSDGTNVVAAVGSQLNPRFWDLYHIGMTPSAGIMPRLTPTGENKKPLFSGSYDLFEVPPRLVVQPTMLDLGGREERIAQYIPNHAFSTVIRTTGPTKQRYVPVNPVEVAISRDVSEVAARVTWSIPIPPEILAASGSEGELPLPAIDSETSDKTLAESGYALQPRRLVATVAFGGNPQDENLSKVRKDLYDSVVKDGLKPQLDESGRPKFFFLQNDAKACYVADGGLGMAVYEWRPKFAKGNEVGIELER